MINIAEKFGQMSNHVCIQISLLLQLELISRDKKPWDTGSLPGAQFPSKMWGVQTGLDFFGASQHK